VVKGTSSAILLSVLIHAGLFLLAAGLVVFVVVEKQDPVFEEVQTVERPKMKLKKPRVRQKTKSKPSSSLDRISAVKGVAVLPEMDLPGMGGMGEGLDVEIDMLDIELNFEPTVMGSVNSIGSDLEGTYYDLKYTRSGTFAPVSGDEWRDAFYRMIKSGLDDRELRKYYRAPQKLYTTYVLFPKHPSAYAPVSFGMPDDKASGGLWIVHYTGQLVHKDGITFRFWAYADDSLGVLVDRELVLAASLTTGRQSAMYRGLWQSTSSKNLNYSYNAGPAWVGDWITLEPGVPKRLDILVADNNARNAGYGLMVEEEGVEYPNNYRNGPLLPIFRMDKLTHEQLDVVYKNFPDEMVDFVNGPIFRQY
jgi:hypothetical protein